MKSTISKSLGAVVAVAALAAPHAAMAQDCIEQADLEAATIYMMPVATNAVIQKCGDSLSSDGFLATGKDQFLAPYVAKQSDAWPATLRVIETFASSGQEGGGDFDLGALMASLPEDAAQSMLNSFASQMLIKEIPAEQCGNIERGLKLIAPLPPENVGGLVSFLMEMAGVEKPSICSKPGTE